LLFRQFCRDVISKPEVLEALEAEALVNPAFALKLAEFGIGRPFQAVHVTSEKADDGIYRSEFADGAAVHTAPAEELPN